MFYIIFVFFAILALIVGKRKINNFNFILLLLFTIFIVGFRGDDVDNDYQSYLGEIYSPSGTTDGINEFSFYYIRDFAMNIFASPLVVFIVYAFLGVSLKLFAIRRISNYFWLSILMYFSTFLILQEFNTIRAGVATGFLLLGIPLWGGDKPYRFLPFLCLSIFFHYSFFILIPVFFLVRNNDRYLKVFVFCIPLFYLLYFIASHYLSDLLSLINIGFIKDKKDAYSDADYSLNPFATIFLFKISLILIFYFFRKYFQEFNKYFYILLKLYIIGVLFVILFADLLPTVAQRFYEIFVIVEILLFPLFMDTKFKYFVFPIIVAYSFFFLHLYIEIAEYIRNYQLIFDI